MKNSESQFSSAALARVLRTIRRHGDFYATGTAEITPPNLTVQGLGMVSLPFQHSQLAPLLARAELAPFGRGEQTLIDTSVRNTWQIDAAALEFGGRNWQRTLDAIVARAADGLGVLDPVRAQLYKLLVYDTGSFFIEHRDTEKAAGMFATLVLVLPSLYGGGELLIRHGECEVRLDLSGTDPGDAAFAAFYADCVHEVLPVTSGARLALVYNLIRDGAHGALSAPEHGAEVGTVTELLRGWIGEQATEHLPLKLVYPLEHAYSQAELGFGTLKGVDAAVAQVLLKAAALGGCDVHLALLEVEESGSADYDGDFRRRYRGYDEEFDTDEFCIGEVLDHSATLSCWRAGDGSAPALGALPVHDDELCPPGVFDEAEPDELHFHEATGNEGASFDRAYRRAALVLWPRSRRMTVISAAPLAASLPYLESVVDAWLKDGAVHDSKAREDAVALAGLMIGNWPHTMHNGAHAARMLASLALLRHTALIEAYLEQVAGAGRFGGDEAAAAADALALLQQDRAATLADAVVAANVSYVPAACAALLSHCYRTQAIGRNALRPAVRRLADAMLGRFASPSTDRWRPTPAMDASAVLAVLSALRAGGDADLALPVVDRWLATFSLDGVLVKVAQAVAADNALGSFGPAEQIRATVLARIGERIDMPLLAPSDWRRASKLSCSCQYCAQLALFLDDPGCAAWTLKAAEIHRRHVQDTIERHHCDLDYVTVRQSRPYGLACTKNLASYDAKCRQRTADLVLVSQLAAQKG